MRPLFQRFFTARTAALLLAGLAIGAPAGASSRADRQSRDLAAAVPAGKPESCIPLVGISESRVLSDQVIDFHMRGGKVYRNTLPNQCPELGFERAFSYETSLSQLCSTDIITVFRNGGGPHRGVSCGLGQFQPVTGVHR